MRDKIAVTVTTYRDGPLVVRGRAHLFDAAGRQLTESRGTVALCRCGKSRLKPFCDGTHKQIGFTTAPEPR